MNTFHEAAWLNLTQQQQSHVILMHNNESYRISYSCQQKKQITVSVLVLLSEKFYCLLDVRQRDGLFKMVSSSLMNWEDTGSLSCKI